ncbi:MAG: twin-arginine translocase TatA/TatE family subunit [Legionella sp.]
MSAGELLLILLVTLLVFGPKKLPMLATHLGLLLKKINGLKQQASVWWHQQQQQLTLQENERKAQEADALYKQSTKSNSENP